MHKTLITRLAVAVALLSSAAPLSAEPELILPTESSTIVDLGIESAPPHRIYVIEGLGSSRDVERIYEDLPWTRFRLRLSTNRGQSWDELFLPESVQALTLAFDPQRSDSFYLGTDRGVFRSTDGGRHWEPCGLEHVAIRSRALIPPRRGDARSSTTVEELIVLDDGSVLAGIAFRQSHRGRPSNTDSQNASFIHRSPGDCRAWEATSLDWQSLDDSAGRDLVTSKLRSFPEGILALVGGRLFHSTDDGDHWQDLSRNSEYLREDSIVDFAVSPAAPHRLYATDGSGLFVSEDLGRSWRLEALQMMPIRISNLATDPIDPKKVFTASDAGLLVSGEAGRMFLPGKAAAGPPDPAAFDPQAMAGWLGAQAGGSSGWIEALPGQPPAVLRVSSEGLYRETHLAPAMSGVKMPPGFEAFLAQLGAGGAPGAPGIPPGAGFPGASPFGAAPRPSRGATLFEHGDFEGQQELFTTHDANLRDNPIGNDNASSIEVSEGCRVILYRDADFEGKRTELTADRTNLRKTRVGNDEVSSIEVFCSP